MITQESTGSLWIDYTKYARLHRPVQQRGLSIGGARMFCMPSSYYGYRDSCSCATCLRELQDADNVLNNYRVFNASIARCIVFKKGE